MGEMSDRIITKAIVARSGYLPYFDADDNLFFHYQPESELLKPEFLDALKGLPVVVSTEHPYEITHDNIRELRDGSLGLEDARIIPATDTSPLLIEVDLFLDTDRGLAAFDDGLNLVSLGCDGTQEPSSLMVDSIPVTTIRRDIVPNHLLLCDGGLNRSGSKVSIVDGFSYSSIASEAKVGDSLVFAHDPSLAAGVLKSIEGEVFTFDCVDGSERSGLSHSYIALPSKTGDAIHSSKKETTMPTAAGTGFAKGKDPLAEAQAENIALKQELKTLQDSIPAIKVEAGNAVLKQAQLRVLADSLKLEVTDEMKADPAKTLDALTVLNDAQIYGLELEIDAAAIAADPLAAKRAIVEKAYDMSAGVSILDSLGELDEAQAGKVVDSLYRKYIDKLADAYTSEWADDGETEETVTTRRQFKTKTKTKNTSTSTADSILVTESSIDDIAKFAGFDGSPQRVRSVLSTLASAEDSQFGMVV
jgi:Uncharacterized protein conserved in bacteria (DUF2213)